VRKFWGASRTETTKSYAYNRFAVVRLGLPAWPAALSCFGKGVPVRSESDQMLAGDTMAKASDFLERMARANPGNAKKSRTGAPWGTRLRAPLWSWARKYVMTRKSHACHLRSTFCEADRIESRTCAWIVAIRALQSTLQQLSILTNLLGFSISW
jgi:hypothetical protein